MTDMFLERKFESPITTADFVELLENGRGCLDMHQVAWDSTCLAADGSQMFCWFRAPDAESARIAMRKLDIDLRWLWSGSVHDKPGLVEADIAVANVLVERSFEEGTPLQVIQEIEDAGVHCLETRNVSFKRTFHSNDQKRMICLYHAPDAESVRVAQREAGVPFADVWSFRMLSQRDISDLSD